MKFYQPNRGTAYNKRRENPIPVWFREYREKWILVQFSKKVRCFQEVSLRCKLQIFWKRHYSSSTNFIEVHTFSLLSFANNIHSSAKLILFVNVTRTRDSSLLLERKSPNCVQNILSASLRPLSPFFVVTRKPDHLVARSNHEYPSPNSLVSNSILNDVQRYIPSKKISLAKQFVTIFDYKPERNAHLSSIELISSIPRLPLFLSTDLRAQINPPTTALFFFFFETNNSLPIFARIKKKITPPNNYQSLLIESSFKPFPLP